MASGSRQGLSWSECACCQHGKLAAMCRLRYTADRTTEQCSLTELLAVNCSADIGSCRTC